MKGLAKIFVTIVGLALVGFVVLSTLFIRVHPWSYGVKENLVAGGVSESDARTGFAFRIPGVHKWHMIDRRTHFDLLDGQPSERHRNDARGAGDPDQGRQPRQLRPDHHLQGDRRQGERDRPSGQRREVPRPGGRRHRGHDARGAREALLRGDLQHRAAARGRGRRAAGAAGRARQELPRARAGPHPRRPFPEVLRGEAAGQAADLPGAPARSEPEAGGGRAREDRVEVGGDRGGREGAARRP